MTADEYREFRNMNRVRVGASRGKPVAASSAREVSPNPEGIEPNPSPSEPLPTTTNEVHETLPPEPNEPRSPAERKPATVQSIQAVKSAPDDGAIASTQYE
jgi:hypothetical protein